ncbi:hypothetical protein EON67_05515 [archaeon]|nr:MAG: hypothetical protein EON67_05515 [archaeon]
MCAPFSCRAARKLQELKRGAEREDILRALDSLEGNEALLMDVSSRLGERARAAQSAKALAEAQAEALREALEAVTARSHK